MNSKQWSVKKKGADKNRIFWILGIIILWGTILYSKHLPFDFFITPQPQAGDKSVLDKTLQQILRPFQIRSGPRGGQ